MWWSSQWRAPPDSACGAGRDAFDRWAKPPSFPRPPLITVLTAADLGAPLGARGTLVQFSSEVCAYCGPTRELLAEVARDRDGLAFVEIDATERFDLTRRLRVFSTPTVLVLAADGSIAGRASGRPRKSDVLAAVGTVLGEVAGEGDSEAAGE